LLHQIVERFSYGAARNKWVTIFVHLFVLVIYFCVEVSAKPTEKYFDELTCSDNK